MRRASSGKGGQAALVRVCSAFALLTFVAYRALPSTPVGFVPDSLTSEEAGRLDGIKIVPFYRYSQRAWHFGMLPDTSVTWPLLVRRLTTDVTVSRHPASRERLLKQDAPASMPQYIQAHTPTYHCINEERVGQVRRIAPNA